MRFILKAIFSSVFEFSVNLSMRHMIQLVMSVSIESILNKNYEYFHHKINNWFSLLDSTHSNSLNRISSLLDLRFEASVLFELWNVVMIILITSKLDELVVSLFDIYPLQTFAFLPFYSDANRKREEKKTCIEIGTFRNEIIYCQ